MVRYAAVPEVTNYVRHLQWDGFTVVPHYRQTVLRLFDLIQNAPNTSGVRGSSRLERRQHIKETFIANHSVTNLPVVWTSSINPSYTNRFLVHLLLSMGKFTSELELYESGSIRQAYIRAGLLDESAVDESINVLMKDYVIDQLMTVTGGTQRFDRYLQLAYQAVLGLFRRNALFCDGTHLCSIQDFWMV